MKNVTTPTSPTHLLLKSRVSEESLFRSEISLKIVIRIFGGGGVQKWGCWLKKDYIKKNFYTYFRCGGGGDWEVEDKSSLVTAEAMAFLILAMW